MNCFHQMINYLYEVLGGIGEGSQGSVVQAISKVTDELVAIKIFDLHSKQGLTGYLNELSIYHRLSKKSPRMCQLVESVEFPTEGRGYIVMKKYQNDLFDLCFESSTLSPETIKSIFKQIALGVRDLHRKRIAHLDLKPENILIDSAGNAFICDFGCSYYCKKSKQKCIIKRIRSLAEKEKTKLVGGLQGRGTKKYSAPEVLNNNEFDPFKADIYSLGVILHVLITGFYPVPGDLAFAALSIDDTCIQLLEMMMHVDPEKRNSIEQVLAHPWFGSKTKRRIWFK